MGEGVGEDDDYVDDDDDDDVEKECDGDGDVVCERSAITANARWENNQLMWTAFLATLISDIEGESSKLQSRGYQNVFLSDPSPIIGNACHSLPNWLTNSLTPVK